MNERIKLVTTIIIPPIPFSFLIGQTDLVFIYLLLVLPLYLAIVVDKFKTSGENEAVTVVSILMSIFICYDISFEGVFRAFISMMFFDGVDMTRDPGTHIIAAMFAVITVVIVPVFYSIIKKFNKRNCV